MSNYTKQDLTHAETKAAEWTTRGDAELPGSASRAEAWEQARKWERTAESIRETL